jgi:hypothetical protein
VLRVGPIALLVLAAGGCDDRALEAGFRDLSTIATTSDLAQVGQPVLDLSVRDESVFVPDSAAGDLLPFDAGAPDLAMPDLTIPLDLMAPSDLTTPPDLATPPDLTTLPDLFGLPAKRIFVTSKGFDGNLGGLSGADAKCQMLADAAGLGGTYKAWLSDSTTSAKDRLAHSATPYVLVNGGTVADDWNDLTSGGPKIEIWVTETNGAVNYNNVSCGSATSMVFTGTWPDGSKAVGIGYSNCSDWTSNVGDQWAVVGGSNFFAGPSWTDGCIIGACANSSGLYCLEQ